MVENDQERECPFCFMNETYESAEDINLPENSVANLEPHHLLLLRWFFNNSHAVDEKLSKQIISFDERFLLGCLELIHAQASRVATCNLSPDMEVLSDSLDSRQDNDIWMDNKTDLVVECSREGGNGENVVMKSTEDWIVGSITGSKSMMNILKSPLLNRPGTQGSNSGKMGSLDYKDPKYSDVISSRGGFSTSSSVGFPGHRKHYSMSTTISTCSDQSSFVASVISHGMLEITWKDDLPHFVLSMDGKKEVYVADVVKANSADDKCLDYLYTFRLRPEGKLEDSIRETELAFLGKMTVSTSFTLSLNELEIMETLFVLYGYSDDCAHNSLTSNHIRRKNTKLSKKGLVDMFRQRKLLKFDERTNAILEESSMDTCGKPDLAGINHTDYQLITNFEQAAIVVRSHLHNNTHKKAGAGGWGLNFLKKTRVRQEIKCLETTSVECSTTTNVIIPAGFHGGPVTRNGGPTSLIDRWSSGGHCECGGWDIGCPLTILNTRRNPVETFSGEDDVSIDCKTIDLFVQGSRQNVPIMKVSNLRDDLFYVHFEPNLSPLQSFAIAVAIIHSHEPIFRSKMYRR
ncbi:unnamed protein product [Cuscuta campestris]|uniref:Uncharacterized protein n=1 Tax=Cuscuta campestris TaxID=132261 RepID=A0A484KBF8_9ASTE|nr:unnamed protein product [Cuscuta campestris]